MFDGIGDPDAHIRHYEAVGMTKKWSDEEMKMGFHRTLKDMALQWYEMGESIHTDTWTILKDTSVIFPVAHLQARLELRI